jgi:hypothetical protein
MGDPILTIRDIRVRAVNAPLARPIRTAVGSIPSAPLLLLDLDTDQGVVGRSYIFAYTPAALAPLARLAAEISGELAGQPVVPVDILRGFDRLFQSRRLFGQLFDAILQPPFLKSKEARKNARHDNRRSENVRRTRIKKRKKQRDKQKKPEFPFHETTLSSLSCPRQ